MSVTSLLDTDEKFREIVREHLPKKEQFRTNKGDKAFSRDYELLAPNTLNNRFYSTLVGTAFDYAARFIVARYACVKSSPDYTYTNIDAEMVLEVIEANTKQWLSGAAESSKNQSDWHMSEIQKDATSNLNSLHGFMYIQREVEKKDKKTYQKLYGRYVQALACVRVYFQLSSGNSRAIVDHNILIEACCYLARMEQIYRSGGIMPRNGYERLLENEPKEVYTDLKRLCDVFFDTFITSGIVHEGSQVVFNPTFGRASNLVGGADADIYIDGVLYDFKTTKESRYHWEDVAQIYVYYLLHCLNELTAESMSAAIAGDKRAHHMITGTIEKIALYKARFGAIESLDVSLIEGELDTIRKLMDYLGAKKNNNAKCIAGKGPGNVEQPQKI